jgi:two-component system C4-dicarboxylate transport sensor histidine kinase DctB
MSRKINVLVVANDPTLIYNFQEFAKDSFETLEVVDSTEAALNIHEIGRFDIIYIDLNLPNMSALELIKNIKNYDKNQEFIVLIDEKNKNELLPLIRNNISSFIVKPVNKEKFMQVTEKTKLLLKDCVTCISLQELQSEIEETSYQHGLKTNILIQQSKLAQTGEMISMIAHQWRQPLSAITAIVGSIRTRMELDMYKKNTDPYLALENDLYSAFHRIEESADFLSKTVNDFRNFYRPETGINKFNVSELIESVCRMALLDKDQLNIELKITADTSITLTSFENELKQVLINIINNAKDAFAEKSIQNPKLRIALKQGGAFVYINVTDNAGGIDPAHSEQIFLPYFSTKSEKNGTGIGLHMSKTIIENHLGGVLSMSNNMAFGGADFCIKIPLIKEDNIA